MPACSRIGTARTETVIYERVTVTILVWAVPIPEQADETARTIPEKAENNAHTRSVAKRWCTIPKLAESQLGHVRIRYNTRTKLAREPHTSSGT